MRRIRYSVAMSLDGYIADAEGGYDWIVNEPGIDFAAFMSQIDTVFVGRKSYEVAIQSELGSPVPGAQTYVFSTTLDPAAHPDVTVLGADWESTVREVVRQSGKDIWLWGGGELFRALLEKDLVDTVEVGIIPVLLGTGIPLLPSTAHAISLVLQKVERFPSGVMLVRYDVRRGAT